MWTGRRKIPFCFAEPPTSKIRETVLTDGLTRNEPIICACSVNADGIVFLVNTTDHLVVLIPVITDNAANVARMRLQMQEKTDDVIVITYACSAHLLNLLAKDLNIEGVMNNIVWIINHSNKSNSLFRNDSYNSDFFAISAKALPILKAI
ncbi:hypothetical protein NQ317_000607 [Molorchus minor]|uniref:DUF659 domain-containing protein n=1 Tax=Molorchus minor TaxID=1323400 RepID=A0ABQ9JS27_9CUCU|nr:hypothetical protein NQ317_000607 [Molorchus minor]